MRSIAGTLAGLGAAGLLAGCATLPGLSRASGPQLTVSTAGMPGELEPVRAAAVVNDAAVFWVTSNGCTSRDDLKPMVSLLGDASVITLRRLTEDRCDTPQADGVEVMWSFDELGIRPGTTVSINNPLQLPQT
ncbi:MAG: hypothetical protein EON96_13450 [Caulobacteraceae bacterium]|nr:MAG: hypothetical protein EON96_13450 [Caulobacteraceae bacterium]